MNLTLSGSLRLLGRKIDRLGGGALLKVSAYLGVCTVALDTIPFRPWKG